MSLLLLAAAAAAAEPPICADRPAKANGTCTVPAGRIQIEMGAVDWTRIKEGGSKLGLDDRSDLELNVTPYVRIKGEGGTVSGFGDILVRYKNRLTNEGAPVQIALLPSVKLPTAKHDIGDGKLEGGLAIPVS